MRNVRAFFSIRLQGLLIRILQPCSHSRIRTRTSTSASASCATTRFSRTASTSRQTRWSSSGVGNQESHTALRTSSSTLSLLWLALTPCCRRHSSNFNLRSGTSKVAEMLDRGIKVSLGTDVSGGFGLGILTTLCVHPPTLKFISGPLTAHPDSQTASVHCVQNAGLSRPRLAFVSTGCSTAPIRQRVPSRLLRVKAPLARDALLPRHARWRRGHLSRGPRGQLCRREGV